MRTARLSAAFEDLSEQNDVAAHQQYADRRRFYLPDAPPTKLEIEATLRLLHRSHRHTIRNRNLDHSRPFHEIFNLQHVKITYIFEKKLIQQNDIKRNNKKG